MAGKVMNIALVEFIDEAKIILEKFAQNQLKESDTLIISLNPNVRAFLKNKGVSSKSTLEYFDAKAHEKTLRASEAMSQILEKNVNIVDEVGIKETYNNSFLLYARLMLSYYVKMIEILDNVNRIHRPDEIIVFRSLNLPFNSADLKNSERYIGLLAKDYCDINKIKCSVIDIETFETVLVSQESWFEKILSIPIVCSYSLVLALYRKKKTVLIADFSYNMDFLVDDAKKNMSDVSWILLRTRKKGVFLEWLASLIWVFAALIKKPLNLSGHKTDLNCAVPFYFFKTYYELKKINRNEDSIMSKAKESIKDVFSKFDSAFLYKGVDFSKPLLDKINLGILGFISELKQDTEVLYSLTKKVNPDFIVSPEARNIYFSLGEIGKVLSVPSLLISHASHIKPKNELEEIEHDHLGRGLINTEYSLVAVQSPHAKEYANYFKIKSRVFDTEPLLWARATKTRKEIYEKLIGHYDGNMRIFLHAGTPKTRAGIRFHIYETLDEYVEGLKDIVEAVDKLDNTLLVIQFRPWNGLSVDDLKELLPKSKKVVFSMGAPFREVILIADSLISFSSTTIEEALYNNIPVLLYGGGGRYMHLPAFEINGLTPIKHSACYHVSRKELLRDAIDWVLNEHAKKKLTEEELKGYVFQEAEKQSIGDFITKCVYE